MDFKEDNTYKEPRTFKEKFDEYELLFTQIFLIITILMIYLEKNPN